MSAFACPECGNALSDAADVCTRCGWSRYRPSAATLSMGRHLGVATEPASATFPLFPVATHKFLVLSVCSFGVYQLYWCYKNWERIRDVSNEAISPLWRVVFAPLWGFSLFGRIRDLALADGVVARWNPTALALLYLISNLLYRLPDELWWVWFSSLLPMIPVQRTAQRINQGRAGVITEDPNSRYSGGNLVLVCIGGLFLVTALVAPFLPE